MEERHSRNSRNYAAMNKQKLNYCPEVNILQSFGSLKANLGSLTRGSLSGPIISFALLLICKFKVTRNLEESLLEESLLEPFARWIYFICFKGPSNCSYSYQEQLSSSFFTDRHRTYQFTKMGLVLPITFLTGPSFAFAAWLVSLFLKCRFKFHE